MTVDGLRLRIQTARRLGVGNILRVALYRLQLRTGLGAVRVKPVTVPSGPFFTPPRAAPAHGLTAPPFQIRLFGWKDLQVPEGAVPEWLRNPFNGQAYHRARDPWYTLPDFDPEVGDIKCIWELSRFDWLVRLAQHAATAADGSALHKLNSWLTDWLFHNPAYLGPNWKCGQEASIRVLHLAAAQRILGSDFALTPSLRALLLLHLNRIAPTVSYAIAQDNNHGTSEAAALFVGGSWLQASGFTEQGARFARLGRSLLENRAERLIMDDGTFSQYSVNYHRMMLDSLSFAELWRRGLGLPPFSDRFVARATIAMQWLATVVDAHSGDAPLLGANDGARLFQTGDSYRDYRPSVQLAAALFMQKRAFPKGDWDDHLQWLGVQTHEGLIPPTQSTLLSSGGLAVLVVGQDRAFVRFPRRRFRPAQADALHIDLWCGSLNLLSDAGSYSYNSSGDWSDYFPSTRAHNTVEFDGRDQMPRLSRFLYGAWLDDFEHDRITTALDGSVTWRGGYRDWLGAEHRRTVELRDCQLRVTDRLAGFAERAILRWRMPVENSPENWVVDGSSVRNDRLRIEIQSSAPVSRLEVCNGAVSRYYGAMTIVPVLEVEVHEPAEIVSQIEWFRDAI